MNDPEADPARKWWEPHDVICLTTMIRAAAKEGDLVTAERLFQLAEEADMELDMGRLTAVIDVAAKKGDVAAAERCC